MSDSEKLREDRLNDLFDKFVAGEQPGYSEPAMHEAVRRFFASDDTPALPRDKAAKILEELMSASAIAATTTLQPSIPWSTGRNNHTAPDSRHRVIRHGVDTPRQWRSRTAYLALAAMLLLSLAGGYLAVDRFRSGSEGPQTVPAVAPGATPVASPIALIGHPVVGVWMVGSGSDATYMIFDQNGTFVEYDDFLGVHVGSWRPTGERTAEAVLVAQHQSILDNFDEPGFPLPESVLIGDAYTSWMSIEVDATGNALEFSGYGEPRDANGKVMIQLPYEEGGDAFVPAQRTWLPASDTTVNEPTAQLSTDHAIVGVWAMNHQPTLDDPDLSERSMHIFDPDGTYVSYDDFSGISIGNWRATGDDSVDVVWVAQHPIPLESYEAGFTLPESVLMPPDVTGQETLVIDEDGLGFVGTGYYEPRNADGSVKVHLEYDEFVTPPEFAGKQLVADRMMIISEEPAAVALAATPAAATPVGDATVIVDVFDFNGDPYPDLCYGAVVVHESGQLEFLDVSRCDADDGAADGTIALTIPAGQEIVVYPTSWPTNSRVTNSQIVNAEPGVTLSYMLRGGPQLLAPTPSDVSIKEGSGIDPAISVCYAAFMASGDELGLFHTYACDAPTADKPRTGVLKFENFMPGSYMVVRIDENGMPIGDPVPVTIGDDVIGKNQTITWPDE